MELNGYRIMWLFVFFDLPTDTKKDRRNAQQFRKNLLKDGFTMMQFSVYMRHCASSESADAHEKRIKALLPPFGKVSILRITDKQYGGIMNFWGRVEEPKKPPDLQVVVFFWQYTCIKIFLSRKPEQDHFGLLASIFHYNCLK